MKKLISTIMALTVASTGLLAMNTQAIGRKFDPNSETFRDYVELYKAKDYNGNDITVFMKKFTEDDTLYRDYLHVTHIPAYLKIEAWEDNVFGGGMIDILNSYGLESDFDTVYESSGAISYYAAVPDDFNSVRELYNKVDEIAKIKEFKISGSQDIASGRGYIPFKSPTYYVHGVTEEQIDSLKKYVEDNKLDFTVEIGEQVRWGEYQCNLIPNYEIDLDDHIAIAADIGNTLGINMPIVYQSSGKDLVSNSDIDTIHYIDGDANVDGDMNMADVATVVQMIGNPDEYTVTSQGEFNADLDGNGLTAADAFEIQKKIAEKGLPQ